MAVHLISINGRSQGNGRVAVYGILAPIVIHELREMNTPFVFIATTVSVAHMLVMISLVVLPWIAKPKAKVGNGIISFGALQTFHRLTETILLDAIIEALSAELVGRNSYGIRQTVRGIHYRKSS